MVALVVVYTYRARETLLTVVLGELLVQLGLMPVVAVIPGLSTALGVGPAEGAWILTVFMLALAGTLLVCGRVGDLLGHRRVFGWGALVYTLGSLLAGLAGGLEMLLLARGLQGIGAAMVSGNNLAILSGAMPADHLGKAVAVIATAASLSAVIGAALGTAAIAFGGWPLLFWSTAPLGAWAAWRARRLPGLPDGRAPVSVDWAGAALLVGTLSLVAVALNHPHTTTSEAVMPLFHAGLPALAIVTAGAFVIVERWIRVPLMDWGQLRRGDFGAAIGLNTVLHLTMMASMFLGPVLVVQGLGRSTTAGGMLMVVVQTSVVATAFLGGWLYDRTRAWWLRPAALGILIAGFLGWAVSGVAGSYPAMIAIGFFTGVGSGVLLAVNNVVIMQSLPGEFRGVASGMLETTRQFGHAFGVTIPTAILALVLASGAGQSAAIEAAALRWGFFWSCLGMAATAALALPLALVRSRAAERERGIMVTTS